MTDGSVNELRCLRCGHVWAPRQEEMPRMCPACKSVNWNRPSLTAHLNPTGEKTEEILGPLLLAAGFVREYCIQRGPTKKGSIRLDYAHVDGKVNIELDGHSHPYKKDPERDEWLRSQGWKVIRVRYGDDHWRPPPLEKITCTTCGYTWTPRITDPKSCPHCKTRLRPAKVSE